MFRKLLIAAAALAFLGVAAPPSEVAARPPDGKDGDGLNARSDKFRVRQGQTLRIRISDLLENDRCERRCKKPISFVGLFTTRKSIGRISYRPKQGIIVFRPKPGFTGKSKFRYSITDRTGRKFSTDTVYIRVRPSPTGPSV